MPVPVLGAASALGVISSSVAAVSRVFLLCGFGAVLAHPRINILTADARQHLNKLVFVVFLPSLIFVKLGEAVTFTKIIDWWFLPVNVIIGCSIGASMGLLLNLVAKTPAHHKRLVIACCCIGNLGNVPYVLVEAICRDAESPLRLANPASCSTTGIAYVSYGMWMAVVVMWTFIYNLLKPSNAAGSIAYTKVSQEQEAGKDIELAVPSTRLSPTTSPAGNGFSVGNGFAGHVEGGFVELPLGSSPAVPAGNPVEALPVNSAGASPDAKGNAAGSPRSDTAGGSNAAEGSRSDSSTLRPPPPVAEPPRARLADDDAANFGSDHAFSDGEGTRWGRFAAQVQAGPLKWGYRVLVSCHIRDIFTPPTTAAMAALVVGAIPALKGLFFGPQALLRVLTDVLNILGMAMIPSMMLVLGGNLSRGPVAVEMRARTVVGITVTRLVILPLLGIGVVQLADRGGLLPAGDPMFRFVLMLQFAMPTAINLGTVAALHGYGEKEASLILFWQYLLATLTMMVFIVIFLAILF